VLIGTYLHDCGLIAAPVAVVRGTEQCNHRVLVAPIVPLHNELMSPDDELEAICVVELLRHILPKLRVCHGLVPRDHSCLGVIRASAGDRAVVRSSAGSKIVHLWCHAG